MPTPDGGATVLAGRDCGPPDGGAPTSYVSSENIPVSDRQPGLAEETAKYRVHYGMLGEVADATVSVTPESRAQAATGDPRSVLLRAVGTGKGAVLGFAKTEKRIESEFNPRTLHSLRWTITRTSNDQTVIDIAEQPRPGTVSLLRKRAGEPDQAASLTRASPILDPLGFLLCLRLGKLQAPASFEILDERALWILTISAVRTTNEMPSTLQLDGRTEPIAWDGSPDKNRTGRSFTLFLSNDHDRTPLRLVVPFGLGEARAELVQIARPATDPPPWHHIVPPFRRFLPAPRPPPTTSPASPPGLGARS